MLEACVACKVEFKVLGGSEGDVCVTGNVVIVWLVRLVLEVDTPVNDISKRVLQRRVAPLDSDSPVHVRQKHIEI